MSNPLDSVIEGVQQIADGAVTGVEDLTDQVALTSGLTDTVDQTGVTVDETLETLQVFKQFSGLTDITNFLEMSRNGNSSFLWCSLRFISDLL